jgi:uncharacterized membrane protein HdeD (DUF308 family)
MKNISPQKMIMLSGVALIIIGLYAMSVYGASAVGIELVAIGALLEIIGYLGGAPWKKDKGQN